MDYRIHTFGCKVNTYDTGLLQKRFEKTSLDLARAKVHVLNTCAVTAEATKEAIRLVRKLKAHDPFCKVVVTGCAAQVDTEKFNIPGADLVVGNSHKGQLEDLIRKLLDGRLDQKIHRDNIFLKKDLEEGGGVELDHTRSFLKIQDGCNSFCTYCVIPFARGRSRSLSVAGLIERVNRLYENGVREVVLTGVHIGDYEDPKIGARVNPNTSALEIPNADVRVNSNTSAREIPTRDVLEVPTTGLLENLMESLLEKTEMPRFRLSSLEPVEVTERMLSIYSASGRFCPHFHMSIQSANTKVLSDMKRKYTAEDVERSLFSISEQIPGAFVGMDVIAGFPGESDDEFEDTFQRLERVPWTRIHVFPYSSRPGTKAEKFENRVNPQVIKERARRLRMLSAERHFSLAQKQVGLEKQILALKGGLGLTRDYWNVRIPEGLEGEFTARLESLVQGGQDRFYFTANLQSYSADSSNSTPEISY
jgi:threonylcarbamoyladenosine tRNA methylthiotransferase MtaB